MKISCSKIKKKIARFISRNTDTEDHVDYLKYHDPLTNFPNRKKLIDLFNDSLARSKQEERVIVVANIDRLHSINELYGREIGDQVIIKLTTA